MAGQAKAPRRLWHVMDQAGTYLVNWLATLLIVSILEWCLGSFTSDPFQTYSFVILQLPFHALVIYASTCMMNIGYHLIILEDRPDASKELSD